MSMRTTEGPGDNHVGLNNTIRDMIGCCVRCKPLNLVQQIGGANEDKQ